MKVFTTSLLFMLLAMVCGGLFTAQAQVTDISTIEGLVAIGDGLDGSYRLTKDLDFAEASSYTGNAVLLAYRPLDNADPTVSGAAVEADPADGLNPGFVPIGTFTSPFTGTLDGDGFAIRNVYINPSSGETGLFGAIEGATITDLGIEDAYVSGQIVGGIAGEVISTASLTNCYVTGVVRATLLRAGGLVGNNGGTLTITNSYTTCSVATIGGLSGAGGFVGNNNGTALTITNSYATGAITGESGSSVGGLVGRNSDGTLTITNAYATGAVSGTNTGGLVGDNFRGTVTATNSYWDSETTTQATSVGGGTAQTTTQLRALDAAATTWSTNDWDFGSDVQYPALRSSTGAAATEGTLFANQPCPRVGCPDPTAGPLGVGVASTDLTLAPNPTSDVLFVRGEASAITLLDLSGHVRRAAVRDESSGELTDFRLDVSGLPAGLYVARVTTPSGIITRRLIVR